MNTLKDQLPSALVPLPECPLTASPVPWLTSIHATPGRGEYGSASYRGNCSGLLIHDLLSFYIPHRVLDPMEGGGTCRDVCKQLQIPYEGRDLRTGFDATKAESFAELGRFDFIWLHPPYFQMVRYNPADSRCLSNAATLEVFVTALRSVFRNCGRVLTERGKLAVLIGDGKHDGRYMGLPFRMFNAAEEEGYQLAAPEIIRFGHGSTSSKRIYSTSFIPRLHDVCLVLEPTRRIVPAILPSERRPTMENPRPIPRIIACEIGPMPHIGDPMPEVTATFDDGKRKALFSYYPDEISFTSEEFVGLTEDEARQLFGRKDRAFLKS